MDSENIFGHRIFELRKAAGMTQKQVGEKVGLSMQAINDIEKGRRETTQTRLVALAELFEVPIDYLLGRGVFKNWDKVLIYREAICRELLNVLPFLEETGLDLMALPEPYFMEMLAATAEKIDYKEENGRPCFDITLYPFY